MSSTDQNRDALFADAKKARKQKKEDEDRNRGGSSSFADILYAPLHLNDYSSIRILGNPAINRLGDETSPKIIGYSMIIGDDDKKFRCIWPGHPTRDDECKKWFLGKIYNKVMSYTWDPTKSDRDYHHRESHPTIFNRVFKNGRPDITFERGWLPSKVVVMNVIDRSLMGVHREKKQTAIVAKKVSESSNGNLFYEPGIPHTVYDQMIWEEIVENFGDWENYDIVIFKTNKDPFYKVYHGAEDFKKIRGKSPLFDDSYLKVADIPLTDEERSWERYNLDQRFPVTSYSKIHNKLSLFIKQVDTAFNTKYLEELEELVEMEKKERAERKENESDFTPVSEDVYSEDESDDEFVDTVESQKAGKVFDDVEDEVDESPPVEEPKSKPQPQKRKAAKSFNIEDYADKFVGISKLSEEEKKFVEDYDEERKTFVYPNGTDLFQCIDPSCPMQSPQWFKHCPMCGEAL